MQAIEAITKVQNIRISGTGKQPMLLAHGFGCDQQMWRFLTPHFANDYQQILFDHVGCGRSDYSAYDVDRHRTLNGYAADVLKICRTLDLRDVVYVGHSVSAMIGALAAIEEPSRFSRIVLVCPSPRYLNDPPSYVGGFERADIESLLNMMEQNLLGFANFLAPAVIGAGNGEGITDEFKASLCAADPFISRRFAEATFFADNREDLAKMTTPSLIIQSANDAIAPISVGEFVHKNLVNSELALMDISGHAPHMSHPEELATIMRRYLSQ